MLQQEQSAEGAEGAVEGTADGEGEGASAEKRADAQEWVEWYELRPESQLQMVASQPGASFDDPSIQQERENNPLYERPSHVSANWGSHIDHQD